MGARLAGLYGAESFAPRAAPERDKKISHVGHTLRRAHGHDVSRFWRDLLFQF